MTAPQARHIDPQAAIGQLGEILETQKRMQTQIEQLTRLNEQLREQKEVLVAEVKQFEVFRPLLTDTRKTQQVFIRNPILIQQLKARLLKSFGPMAGLAGSSKAGKGHVMGSVMFDRAVEECVQYGLLRWHEILPRLEISVDVT